MRTLNPAKGFAIRSRKESRPRKKMEHAKKNRSSLLEGNRMLLRGLCAAGAAAVICLLLPAAARAQGAQPTAEFEPPFVECCKNNTDFTNLRGGPNAVYYPIVGILTLGEKCKALGQSKAGEWIQIVYASAPGSVAWVSAENVIIHYGAGDLPVIQPPATQVPKNQPTLDPTFASQFSSVLPTRLPTFTPATPVATVNLPAFGGTSGGAGLPAALIILALLTVGVFGTIFSAIVGRR
jgi:hypothetical protein